MKLFTDKGYLDIEAIINTKLPFIFICGGRGTGKTYGMLKYVLDHNKKFVFLRRTQSQVDLISKPEFSPFKAITEDTGQLISCVPVSKYNTAFYRADVSEEGRVQPKGPALGYTMALSTISNMRGFDASDCEIMIFDEFIPEKHERPLKNEGSAFLNAYETINRNRELKGDPPLQAVCLANANDIGNPIFTELHLIAKVEHMQRKGQAYSLDYQRGLGIFLISNAPISHLKKFTALYKLADETEFSDMAIKNEFAELKHGSVQSQPIKEYKPLVTLGEITFYKHKADNKKYYCTTMCIGSPEKYDSTDTDIKRFLRKYGYIYTAYMKDQIIFEDTACEVIYNHYIR